MFLVSRAFLLQVHTAQKQTWQLKLKSKMCNGGEQCCPVAVNRFWLRAFAAL
jgi:hypothetical protein